MNDERIDDAPAPPRPRRGRRFLANLGWVLAGGVLAVLLVADPLDLHPVDTWLHQAFGHRHRDGGAATETKQLWTCGMHPQVIMEEPGQCPICGMNLVPMDMGAPGDEHAAASGTAATTTTATERPAGGERQILFYRNPMDPTITSPEPMKDSMGMDYVPVYADQAAAAAGQGAVVTINPAVVQNMNVVTAPVERRDLTREIRTVGYLDYDQQKMVSVTTKYSGFIEKVYVNYIGEPVKRGQPLFDIYSPELVQTQEELLSALAFARRLAGAPDEARRRAEALAEAARTRLGFWDIGADQIRRLEESGKAARTLTVTAPAGGVVMMRMPGLEGMAVKPGMELFHIADLSTLWLSVEVFEDQLPWLREGSEAEVTLSYFPRETFRGRVRFVEPQVAEKTRTVGLRLEVPNRAGRLRAGMYATVRFTPVTAHDAVVVPSQALIRTGERNLVVTALGGGRFAPRDVEVGAEGDRYVEILSGLAPGEQVVTSSQFLIDSESNLREAIQKLIASRQDHPLTPPTPLPPSRGERGAPAQSQPSAHPPSATAPAAESAPSAEHGGH
jgi:membrane fusion protein, copper/silver efflux system